jgi:predicted nucleotidyltransferase
MTADAAIAVVREFAKRVQEEGIPVQEAILFGSHARGAATSTSDIDACIVSPSFGQDPHAELVLLLSIRLAVSDLIEPHPFSPDDIGDPYNPLAAEIRRTGILVALS